jgi:hypothetical protein
MAKLTSFLKRAIINWLMNNVFYPHRNILFIQSEACEVMGIVKALNPSFLEIQETFNMNFEGLKTSNRTISNFPSKKIIQT